MNNLIILDRDGVINQDSDDYIKDPDEWVPLTRSLQAISILKSAGWTIAVATNQSGLARGLFDLDTLEAIHQKMQRSLADYQAKIDYVIWCPHSPVDECECRKPKPGMFRQIASHFNCELVNVPVVGDSRSDLEAAVTVNAKPMLVKTGKGLRSIFAGQLPAGTKIYDDLYDAVLDLLVPATIF